MKSRCKKRGPGLIIIGDLELHPLRSSEGEKTREKRTPAPSVGCSKDWQFCAP